VTGPFSLGNPSEVTVLVLAEKIINFTSSRSGVVHKPLPPDDPVRRRPNIDAAQRLLDCRPRISLDQKRAHTISYFDALLGQAA
jgi:UDP-glucuronate decarboxylase